MSNPKPVEGARLRDEFEIWWADRAVQSIVTSAAKKDLCWLAYKTALSAAPARCNRCQADLCEHDNCTDWACARACGKCAAAAPARDGVREARDPSVELIYNKGGDVVGAQIKLWGVEIGYYGCETYLGKAAIRAYVELAKEQADGQGAKEQMK